MYSRHEVWVPLPQGGRWSWWWRERGSLSASLAECLCRGQKGCFRNTLYAVLDFFSFVVMRQENQIPLLSREGLHCPWCLVNFPWRLRMLVPSLTDQDFVPFFMALPPHAVSLAFFTQSCLDSGSPKMQKTRSCRTSRKHGFSFVISFHIFLVACNEEIALIREPSYCFLSVKRGNSGHSLSASSQLGKRCAKRFTA